MNIDLTGKTIKVLDHSEVLLPTDFMRSLYEVGTTFKHEGYDYFKWQSADEETPGWVNKPINSFEYHIGHEYAREIKDKNMTITSEFNIGDEVVVINKVTDTYEETKIDDIRLHKTGPDTFLIYYGVQLKGSNPYLAEKIFHSLKEVAMLAYNSILDGNDISHISLKLLSGTTSRVSTKDIPIDELFGPTRT